MAAILCCVGASYAATPFAGRRVVEVLRELEGDGLSFIYTTQTLDDSARVAREPQARNGAALAREILKEHGLALLAVAPNTYSIVREAARSETSPPSAPESSTVLSEIIVQSSRYRFSEEPIAPAILRRADVNKLPRLGDDPLRAVQRLPGAASNGWQSLAAIRGGGPNETGIVLDGMRLYEPFHLKDFLSPMSVIDARIIDTMDVHTGGFPARFGDRTSAIIDVRSVHPSFKHYDELGLSALHANGLLARGGEDEAASFMLAARRSNLGELAQFVEHDFGRPSYADGFARIEYRIANTNLALRGLVSRDRISARKDGGAQRTDAEYRNNYVWATARQEWSPSHATEMLVGFTDVTNERTGRAQSVQRQANVTDVRGFHVLNAEIDHEWRGAIAAMPIEQRFGVDVRELSGSYAYASDVQFAAGFPFPQSMARNASQNIALAPEGDELAAYWESRINLNERWALHGGLRFDRQTEYLKAHVAEWSPRLGVLYAPRPTLKLRANWGRFFQLQGLNELQVEDGVREFSPPQRADHWIVGFEHELHPGIAWRVEAYRKEYEQLQVRYENLFDPTSLLPEVEFDRVAIAPERARAEGMELLITVRPAPEWNGWFSYSRSRAVDRIGARNELRSWDQPHALSAGVSWSRGPWSITIADQYHSGWPTTVPAIDANGALVFGPRNRERLGSFHSIDVRAARTFQFSQGELDVFAEATNLFDRSNECCVDYTIANENGSPVLTRRAEYWLGVVPSIGILWRHGRD